jgi:hypothetical protein
MRFFITLLLVVACSVAYADPPPVRGQVPPDSKETLERLPVALRNKVMVVETINFTTVTIDTKNDTITVEGHTPTLRDVHLIPHRHVRKPDFWTYEIVAKKLGEDDVVAEVITPYKKTLKMGDWKGKKGVEVVGEMKVGNNITFLKELKVVIK